MNRNGQEEVKMKLMTKEGEFIIEVTNTKMWNPFLHLVLNDKYRVFEKLGEVSARWLELPWFDEEN